MELYKQNILVWMIFLIIITSLVSQALAVVISFSVSIFILVKSQKIVKNHVSYALFAFLLLKLVVGLLNSSQLTLLFEELLRNFAFFILYSTLISKLDNNSLDVLIENLSILVIVTLFLYPLLQYHGRFTSIFPHPNHLAYACNLLIAYILSTKNVQNTIDKIRIFLLVTLVVLSSSSGGIIATTFTFLLYNFRKSFVNFTLITLLSLILIWFVRDIEPFSIIFEKFSSVNIGEIAERASDRAFGNDTSLVWRLTYWHAIVDSFLDHSSWIKFFGLGIGVMSFPNYYFYWMITDPHNDYVRVLAEIGILGVTFYFFIWIYLLRTVKEKYFLISVFIVPMLVGNMLVNLTFMLLLLLYIERKRR